MIRYKSRVAEWGAAENSRLWRLAGNADDLAEQIEEVETRQQNLRNEQRDLMQKTKLQWDSSVKDAESVLSNANKARALGLLMTACTDQIKKLSGEHSIVSTQINSARNEVTLSGALAGQMSVWRIQDEDRTHDRLKLYWLAAPVAAETEPVPAG